MEPVELDAAAELEDAAVEQYLAALKVGAAERGLGGGREPYVRQQLR